MFQRSVSAKETYMETTDNVEVTEQDSLTNAESSADKVWDSEKYPSWQKNLPKAYWGDERLRGFDSLKDVIETVTNPKTKAPEKYELGLGEGFDDVEKVLRKADVSQDDAKALADALKGKLPKRYTHDSLKEFYGADFEQAEKDFGKAVEAMLGSDEKAKGNFMKLMDNPTVFEFARLVGRNLGDSPNLDLGRQQVQPKKGSGDVITDLLTGKL